MTPSKVTNSCTMSFRTAVFLAFGCRCWYTNATNGRGENRQRGDAAVGSYPCPKGPARLRARVLKDAMSPSGLAHSPSGRFNAPTTGFRVLLFESSQREE